MFSTISSDIAQIDTHPHTDPATKNFPLGEKENVEISNKEPISAATMPVPSS